MASVGSFPMMCLWVLLDVVVPSSKEQDEQQEKDDNRQKCLRQAQSNMTNSALASKNNIDDNEQEERALALLTEAYSSHLSSILSLDRLLKLYHWIRQKVHVLTLPHPLTMYASQIIFQLSQNEYASFQDIIKKNSALFNFKPTANRLQTSQRLSEWIATQPDRTIAILLDQDDMNIKSVTRFCVPNTMLEFDETTQKLSIIALYDMMEKEPILLARSDDEAQSASNVCEDCECVKCAYGQAKKSKHEEHLSTSIKAENITQWQRLAHMMFQDEEYESAFDIYKRCHELYVQQGNMLKTAAELWHAMGAVLLTQKKFIKAQKHWKKHGDEYGSLLEGIQLQLDKQKAYGYFDPQRTVLESRDNGKSTIISKGKLFVMDELISNEDCKKLIHWALEHVQESTDGGGSGGWTTRRHYAVPTTDIPIHATPKLLSWFCSDFYPRIHTILQRQFSTPKRFYIHDAFLVQYTASESNKFLPLHYDESTHSLVIALNDDFEGGGTYFYDLDKVITPKTGSVVSFAGDRLLHGGYVVTKFTRYIIAVFLYLDDDEHHNGSSEENGLQESKRQKLLDDKEAKSFSFGFF